MTAAALALLCASSTTGSAQTADQPASAPLAVAEPPGAPAAVPPVAPPAPPAPQASAPPAVPSELPAVVIDPEAADTLLGKPVEAATGEDMGRIVDVIVDRSGTMRAVVVDFGGFLGMGSRKIAVDWRVLHFPDKGDLSKIVAELPRDQLRVAPVFNSGEPVVVVGRSDPPAITPTAVAPVPVTPAPATPAVPAPVAVQPAPPAPAAQP